MFKPIKSASKTHQTTSQMQKFNIKINVTVNLSLM